MILYILIVNLYYIIVKLKTIEEHQKVTFTQKRRDEIFL